MDCDVCSLVDEDAVTFVLGDLSAERRADMVIHLSSCAPCRREVATLTAALDAISASTVSRAPSPGFVDRVLAAAEEVGLVAAPAPSGALPEAGSVTDLRDWKSARRSGAAGDAEGVPRGQPRPVPVVLRRRRTVAALTGMAAVLALCGLAFRTWFLIGPAVAAAVLDAVYLGLVMAITRTRARDEIVEGFQTQAILEDADWTALEVALAPERSDETVMVPVVEVPNASLVHFLFSYFVGWALTPLVAVIRLMRGDLTGLEESPVLEYIVSLQRRGRAQSLKLLVAGATSVAVVGGGAATIMVAPGLAAAAPAQSYTVHSGDTLSGIAARFGTSTESLAQINGIVDPNAILAGEVIRIGNPTGATTSSTTTSYTVQDGDTLGSIAERFGTTVSALAMVNHLSDPNLILAGQALRLPLSSRSTTSGTGTSSRSTSPDRYTVEAGDTLGSIAERFGTTVSALAAANDLADPNLIAVGQVLSLPGTPATAGGTGASTGSGGSTTAPVTITVAAPVTSGYVNPFEYGSWSPARIDEGVDWIPNQVSPVVAIGDGVITYSSTDSGWPAGGFITYRLTSGNHAGLYIYVAEHITDLLPVGTVVSAGQRIATALPGYPWTEWGWAAASGPEPAPGSQYGGAPDGSPTAGGKAFARFLISLGATTTENPGPGSTTP